MPPQNPLPRHCHPAEYQNYQAARREITEYLHYYMHQRKHSALGYDVDK